MLKVTLRNCDPPGLPSLVAVANQSLVTKMQFHEDKMKDLLEGQALAIKAREAWKQKILQDDDNDDTKQELHEEEELNQNDTATGDPEEPTSEEEPRDEQQSRQPSYAQSLNDDKPVVVNPHAIQAQVLYVVPPRPPTHRRGPRPGIVYLLLTAPDSLPDNDNDPTRELAKRRLQLQLALEALQAVHHHPDLVVEESKNPKVWKEPPLQQQQTNTTLGTIFETPEYLAYQSGLEERETNRQAKAKPAPGGGVAFRTAEAAAPVAAIVEFLQKKRDDAKQKKLAKRKEKRKDLLQKLHKKKTRRSKRKPQKATET